MFLFELFSPDSATLYVHRPLEPSEEFLAWLKEHFEQSLAADEFHVTIAHSKTPFHNELKPSRKRLVVTGGERSLTVLGDKGALVLKFESADLQERWQEFCDEGAKWDWPSYLPHVTITYQGADVDIGDIPPFTGPLEFSGEVFEPVTDHKPSESATRDRKIDSHHN